MAISSQKYSFKIFLVSFVGVSFFGLSTPTQSFSKEFDHNFDHNLMTDSPSAKTQSSSAGEIRIDGFSPQFEADSVTHSPAFVDTSVDADQIATKSLNAPACSTTGNQPTLLILGRSPTQSGNLLSREFYEEFMFGSGFPSVRTYFEEASYGKTTLSGEVSDWLDLPFYPGCDYTNIVNATLQVAEPRYDLSRFNRITVIGAGWSGCTFSGISSLGCRTFRLPSGALWTGSISFADDKYTNSTYSPLQKTQIMIHEFGHALGLGHSNLRAERDGQPNSPSGYVIEPVGPILTSWKNPLNLEYGDLYSVMGLGPSNHVSAHHKKRMNWLNPYDPTGSVPGPYYLEVTQDGEFLIEPMHLQSQGIKALRINRSVLGGPASSDYYWIEFRQRAGYDQGILDRDQFLNGALIHLEYPGQREYSHVLDFNPGDFAAIESTLEIGKTFADPFLTTFSLSAVGIEDGKLKVKVNITQPECNGILTSSLIPLDGSQSTPLKTKDFILSLKNNNSPNCSTKYPEVRVVAPQGWKINLPGTMPDLPNRTLTTLPFSLDIPKGTKPYSFGITTFSKVAGAFGESFANTSLTISKQEVEVTVAKIGARTFMVTAKGFKANKPSKPVENIMINWNFNPLFSGSEKLFSSGKTNAGGSISWTVEVPSSFRAGNYQFSFASFYKGSSVYTAPNKISVQVD